MMLRYAFNIAQNEGLFVLLKRAVAFFIPYLFSYKTYHLLEDLAIYRDESEFNPRIPDMEFHMVRSNIEADGLVRDGYKDFRMEQLYARHALECGAIAFCIYLKREVAHITWVAFNKKAQAVFFPIPYYVDYLNRQAYTGGSKTVSKYRGKGLMTYAIYKKLQYLNKIGFTSASYVLDVRDIAPFKAHAKFNPVRHGELRYIRIIGLIFWKIRLE